MAQFFTAPYVQGIFLLIIDPIEAYLDRRCRLA